MRKCLFLLLLALTYVQAQVSNQETSAKQSQLGFDLKATYAEKYLFRGHLFDENPHLQGAARVGIGSWSYKVFYSEPEESGTGEREFNHTVSYTTLVGKRIRTVGYTAFDYEGVRPDTQEFFIREAFQSRWNPTLGLAFDFDSYKGYFLDFSLSRMFMMTRRISFYFTSQVGVAFELDEETNDQTDITEYGFFDDDGLTSGNLTAEFQWRLAQNLDLRVSGEYHRAFDSALYNDLIDKDQTLWKTSISLKLP